MRYSFGFLGDGQKQATKINPEIAAKATAEREKKQKEYEEWYNNVYKPVKAIPVTTCDITDRKYEIVRPCFYQVSNKGLFADKLGKELQDRINSKYLDETKQETEGSDGWGALLYLERSVNQDEFEKAFAVAIIAMKKQALLAGGDAVIGYTQDIDLDTNGPHAWFYLQCYGTIIRFLD